MILVIRNRIVIILAGLIGAEAIAVMVGWIFRMDQLTRFVPEGLNMRFITAFLFLCSAVGLYIMSRAVHYEDSLALLLLPGVSLVILLVTFSLLASRSFNISTGIENLFLTSFDPSVVSSAEWPSFLTLINFSLFGLVGISSLFPGFLRDTIAIYSGYFISLIGLIVAVEYVFNLPALAYSGIIFGVSMAFNTALCFILLGMGLTQIYTSKKDQ